MKIGQVTSVVYDNEKIFLHTVDCSPGICRVEYASHLGITKHTNKENIIRKRERKKYWIKIHQVCNDNLTTSLFDVHFI
jgi:hypothetical protein